MNAALSFAVAFAAFIVTLLLRLILSDLTVIILRPRWILGGDLTSWVFLSFLGQYYSVPFVEAAVDPIFPAYRGGYRLLEFSFFFLAKMVFYLSG